MKNQMSVFKGLLWLHWKGFQEEQDLEPVIKGEFIRVRYSVTTNRQWQWENRKRGQI